MENVEIEHYAEDFSTGRLTKKEGGLKIMELVFKNKYLFGLRELDEDDFLDFLIYDLPRFENIFSTYDKKMGSFFSFLQSNIRCSFFTWRRKHIRSKIIESNISEPIKIQNEETSERYTMDFEKSVFGETKELVIADSYQHMVLSEGMDKTVHGLKKIEVQKKNEELKKLTVLILALKSSFYIDENLILKVSDYTGVSVKKIITMQKSLYKTLSTKIRRRNCCIIRRNNAFYFHRKYYLEMQNLTPDSTWSNAIQDKYNQQTKKWISKNSHLQRKDYYVSASNRAIGKELNVCTRKICYLINRAKKNMDINDSKMYHIVHENISCDRQSE